jgi:hypothetical protein
LYVTVKEGSFGWFGYGTNPFIPPVYVHDPYWKFAETGWSALLIGNFKGPYGDFSYVRPSADWHPFGLLSLLTCKCSDST